MDQGLLLCNMGLAHVFVLIAICIRSVTVHKTQGSVQTSVLGFWFSAIVMEQEKFVLKSGIIIIANTNAVRN